MARPATGQGDIALSVPEPAIRGMEQAFLRVMSAAHLDLHWEIVDEPEGFDQREEA